MKRLVKHLNSRLKLLQQPKKEHLKPPLNGFGQFIVGLYKLVIHLFGNLGTAILAGWAIYATYTIGQEQIRIATKQAETAQQVQGFDTLIRISFAQTDSLSATISILNAQLRISQQLQNTANHNIYLMKMANINRLHLGRERLYKKILYRERKMPEFLSLIDKTKLLEEEKIILESELDNTFLLENKKLFHQWIECLNEVQFWHYYGTQIVGATLTPETKFLEDDYNTGMHKIDSLTWKLSASIGYSW